MYTHVYPVYLVYHVYLCIPYKVGGTGVQCTGITEEKSKEGLKNDISLRNGPNVIIPFLDIIVDIGKLSYATHKELL